MHRYILKRLAMLIFVILGVSFLIFSTMSLAPGDLALTVVGIDASDEEYEAMREELGLNDPLLVRYARYMKNLLQGDLGYSYQFKMGVWELYMKRLPATAMLAFAAMVVAHVISIPLGIYAALRRGSIRDNIASGVSIIGLAAPNFWVGLMLIIVFSLNLGWFNSGGYKSLEDVVLPAITVGTGLTALLTRTTRSSMIDVLSQDYLMLARAKGLSEKKVIRKHALKNAIIPIITISGLEFCSCLGGSVVTETVFAWPGIGQLVINAIKNNDFETVTGAIIMTSIMTSIILLLVDILYAFVDPRIKAQYSK